MKFSEVTFLSIEEVKAAHAAGLADAGGLDGIRDPGMLASSVAAPQQAFPAPVHPTLACMAAALAWSLARNHAFVDGNKRTAHISAKLFLEMNGHPLPPTPVSWEGIYGGVIAGTTTRNDLAALFAREMGRDVSVEDG